MIRIEGLSHSFDGVPALRDVSLQVPTGGTLGLIGPGGAGKSLVLKTLCGLLRPDAGRVWLDDDEVTALGERALMGVRAKIGMVFQNYALFDYLTVGGNIGFPLTRLGDSPPEAIAAKVALRLQQVHLPGIEAKYPRELSGGMKKRVCVARATVHDPPYLLCDDPTAGLDPVTTNRIFGLLKALQAEHGATLLIVSHEVAALAPLCEQFVMLRGGEVVYRGPPDQAHTAADPEVRAFVGQAPVFPAEEA